MIFLNQLKHIKVILYNYGVQYTKNINSTFNKVENAAVAKIINKIINQTEKWPNMELPVKRSHQTPQISSLKSLHLALGLEEENKPEKRLMLTW